MLQLAAEAAVDGVVRALRPGFLAAAARDPPPASLAATRQLPACGGELCSQLHNPVQLPSQILVQRATEDIRSQLTVLRTGRSCRTCRVGKYRFKR